MSRTYTASVPTPEILRPTWGDGPVLAICHATSPTRAAMRLGVPAKELGKVPEGIELGDHDIRAAEHYPDTALYRDPTGAAEWRILDVPPHLATPKTD